MCIDPLILPIKFFQEVSLVFRQAVLCRHNQFSIIVPAVLHTSFSLDLYRANTRLETSLKEGCWRDTMLLNSYLIVCITLFAYFSIEPQWFFLLNHSSVPNISFFRFKAFILILKLQFFLALAFLFPFIRIIILIAGFF